MLLQREKSRPSFASWPVCPGAVRRRLRLRLTPRLRGKTRSRRLDRMRNGRTGKQPDSTKSDQWMALAIRYLARWDRTAAQVEQFLLRKGAAPAQIQQTIGRLSDLRYLNDGAYAERWIETRLARRPMGRERLEAELLLK